MKPIKLFWWRELSGQRNFGDDLAPILIERLTYRPVEFASLASCDIISTGSILDQAIDVTRKRFLSRPFHQTLVWGSGSFGTIKPGYHHLNVTAVRGPRTKQALGLPDSVAIGDPALLLPRIIAQPQKSHRWGIIPHIVHQQMPLIANLLKQPNTIMIDLGSPDPLATARQIASCEFIISSSLHGLITADAFGIPSLWMQPDSSLFGGDWKFHDYFASVQRAGTQITSAINLLEHEPIAERPDTKLISRLGDSLLRALPV